MKTHAFKALCLLAAASLYLLGVKSSQASSDYPANSKNPSYSTTGHGPSILLLHDSSNDDQAWANAARELASRFEVTLVDISGYSNDSQAVQRLRQAFRELNIDASRIAGSAHTEPIALRYALSYPDQSRSFTLPHTSEDLEILASIFKTSHCTNS